MVVKPTYSNAFAIAPRAIGGQAPQLPAKGDDRRSHRNGAATRLGSTGARGVRTGGLAGRSTRCTQPSTCLAMVVVLWAATAPAAEAADFGLVGAASNVLWARWGWPAGMDDFQQRVGIVALPPESVNDDEHIGFQMYEAALQEGEKEPWDRYDFVYKPGDMIQADGTATSANLTVMGIQIGAGNARRCESSGVSYYTCRDGAGHLFSHFHVPRPSQAAVTLQTDRPLRIGGRDDIGKAPSYFEVTVEKLREDATLAVGFATYPYPPYALPGHRPHSLGIHFLGQRLKMGAAAAGVSGNSNLKKRMSELNEKDMDGSDGSEETKSVSHQEEYRANAAKFFRSCDPSGVSIPIAAPVLQPADVIGCGFRVYEKTEVLSKKRRRTSSAVTDDGDESSSDEEQPRTRVRTVLHFFVTVNGQELELPEDKAIIDAKFVSRPRNASRPVVVSSTIGPGILANGVAHPTVSSTHVLRAETRFEPPFRFFRNGRVITFSRDGKGAASKGQTSAAAKKLALASVRANMNRGTAESRAREANAKKQAAEAKRRAKEEARRAEEEALLAGGGVGAMKLRAKRAAEAAVEKARLASEAMEGKLQELDDMSPSQIKQLAKQKAAAAKKKASKSSRNSTVDIVSSDSDADSASPSKKKKKKKARKMKKSSALDDDGSDSGRSVAMSEAGRAPRLSRGKTVPHHLGKEVKKGVRRKSRSTTDVLAAAPGLGGRRRSVADLRSAAAAIEKSRRRSVAKSKPQEKTDGVVVKPRYRPAASATAFEITPNGGSTPGSTPKSSRSTPKGRHTPDAAGGAGSPNKGGRRRSAAAADSPHGHKVHTSHAAVGRRKSDAIPHSPGPNRAKSMRRPGNVVKVAFDHVGANPRSNGSGLAVDSGKKQRSGRRRSAAV